MAYTKPVIREPYDDCPVWIENKVDRKEFVCLSAESNEQDEIRVWSDDPESDRKKDLHFIDFTYKEIIESLENTKNDLVGFINNPLFHWIYKRDEELAIKVKQQMYHWFIKE